MSRAKYRLLDVTPVGKNERIATFERVRGWIWKKVDTFQIRGYVNDDEWFYYPEGDTIPNDLQDHLDNLVSDHTDEASHAYSVEFQKKQRLAHWAAEGKKK